MILQLEVGCRRRCDNDGHFYTVKSSNNRFCSDKCRKQFHRFGSPFLKLREQVSKEADRAGEEIEFRLFSILDHNSQDRYRRAFPRRAARFDEQLQQASQAS
jgi:hypothetical protein